MKRRLFFLLPNVESARQTANDLLLARVTDRNMRFLAKRGTDLAELHEAGVAHKSDMLHGGELGGVLGGVLGVLAGIALVLSPPGGGEPVLALILVTTLVGALLGIWIGSMVGASVPNSRFRQFADELERGSILLMVDVPRQRIDEIRELVTRRHPEAVPRGMDPMVPIFP